VHCDSALFPDRHQRLRQAPSAGRCTSPTRIARGSVAAWQRGSNENTNGLLRQYLPKGTDLSVYSQAELNQIALSLNTRPRKRHQFRTPLEVYNDHLRLTEATAGTIH